MGGPEANKGFYKGGGCPGVIKDDTLVGVCVSPPPIFFYCGRQILHYGAYLDLGLYKKSWGHVLTL